MSAVVAGETLLSRYDAALLDLDGTVYHGSHAVPGAASTVRAAHESGVYVRFVTNNASKAPGQVAGHLTGMGIPATAAEVATSAQAGAALLAERVPAGGLVLVVGTESLAAEVTATGLRVTRTHDVDVVAVVQGHSPSTGWADLAEACSALRAGAVWVACNVDPTLPTERGQLPGNGSMVAALRTATGRDPEVAGKPAPGLFTEAARGVAAERPIVVGDRLDTDVAGASAAGMDALLVLTGVTTAADLLRAPAGQRPRYLAPDLTALSAAADPLAVGERASWQVRADGDALVVRGDGDPLDLLRALCPPAWDTGTVAVRPADAGAADAVRALGLD